MSNQYRITSADFCPQGENGDLDAYLSPEDLQQIRNLASPLMKYINVSAAQQQEPVTLREQKYE